jgi:hypothetical protein
VAGLCQLHHVGLGDHRLGELRETRGYVRRRVLDVGLEHLPGGALPAAAGLGELGRALGAHEAHRLLALSRPDEGVVSRVDVDRLVQPVRIEADN